MYFDDYSTSFQSLYGPMYNLQTNYSAYSMPYAGGAYAGGMFPYMGGAYNGSLTNVPVGQFGADQLVRNDETRNNYYAAPIAPHKKKDELPTILGIIGTALGTAAMALALAKGRGKKVPKPVPPKPPVPPTPVPPKPLPPTPVPPKPVPPTPVPPTPVPPTPVPPTPVPPKPVPPTPVPPTISGYLPAATTSSVKALPAATTPVKGLLPAHTPSATTSSVNYGSTVILPSSGSVYNMPAGTTKVAGALPQTTTPVAGLLPAHTPATPVNTQTPALPPIGDLVYGTKNRFPGVTNYQNFGDDLLTKINSDYSVLKHPEKLNGEIVWTTHTPKTYSDAHSIGANAKGADKLAALYESLQK